MNVNGDPITFMTTRRAEDLTSWTMLLQHVTCCPLCCFLSLYLTFEIKTSMLGDEYLQADKQISTSSLHFHNKTRTETAFRCWSETGLRLKNVST